MGLLQSLENRLRQPEMLEQLSEQIASESFERVWRRVQDRVVAFSPAEARGYVRARARLVVEQAVLQASGDLSNAGRARLYVQSMDRLIRRVTNRVHATWSRQRRKQAA